MDSPSHMPCMVTQKVITLIQTIIIISVIHCIPAQADMQQCSAEGKGLQQATKCQKSCFVLHVRNEFGSPCTCDQNVHAELRHCHTATMPQVLADVKLLDTPGDYEVTYTPQCTGDHELRVFVNDQGINESPFKIFVDNFPDTRHCTASGPGLVSVKKDKTNSLSFQINLADTDNKQCILLQNDIVSVSIRVTPSGECIPVTVVSEVASIYRASYIPAVAGEMKVSVMVNGSHINNSPWTVRVDNPPDLSKSRTSFSDIHTIKKSTTKPVTADVYLMDSYNEPCVSEQCISVVIIGRRTLPMAPPTTEPIILCTNIICKSPSHYEVCFIPDRAGEWMVQVEVNGMHTFGSPLKMIIDNPPSIEHCKVYDIPKTFRKGKMCALKLRLADSDGEDCVFPQQVTASVSIPGSETPVDAKVITLPPLQHQISFTPFKTGPHTVKFQINDNSKSLYEVLVINKPDPQYCTASGPGLQLVKKHKYNPVSFLVRLADSDNEPCVSPQNVSVTLRMREIRKRIPVTMVPEAAAVYCVSYIPAVAGTMRVFVRVNGVHIKNSPWKVRVDNPPDIEKCRTSFLDKHTFKKSKTKPVTADVYLMDSYNEPCVSEQTVSVVIIGRRTLPLAPPTREPIRFDIICKSPSHYQVCFIPDIPGEWMVQVQINKIPAFRNSLTLKIDNPPSIKQCKLYVPKKFRKGKMCALKLRLADSDGEDCVFPQHVTASVSIPRSETIVEAKVITLSPNQHQISFTPFKTGPHMVKFQINDISKSLYEVLVINKPDPQYCTASGPGLELVKKHKYNPVSFLVRLADSDNEPCVSPQNVSVTLRMRETRTQIPVTVDPESESVYHLIYTPAVAGEMEVSVMVNTVHIKNSPWRVRVDNPPDLSKSRTSFSDVHTIKKSTTKPVTADVYLMDSYNEPCVSEQTVFVVISGRTTSPIALPTWETIICTDIIYKSPSHYQVCFIPDKPGEWMVWVEVNGIPIFGSPFQISVYNIPSPEHCITICDVPNEIIKGEMCVLQLQLANSDGEDYMFPQHVTASVEVPGMQISVVAKITTLSPFQRQISFFPFKTGSHTVQNSAVQGSETLALAKIPIFSPFQCQLSVIPFKTGSHTVKNCATSGPETSFEAEVITLSPNQYQISFTPFKTGPHTVKFQVKDIGILWSHKVFVVNKPDPQYCTASGPGLELVKKHKYNPVSFLVRLADSDNEPCVSLHLLVTLRMRETEEWIPVTVVSEVASVYRVSYIPAAAGEMEVSVMVNGVHIKNSPWTVCVDNPADLSKSVIILAGSRWKPARFASTSSLHLHVWKDKLQAISADIYLMDSYSEPCVFEQVITIARERMDPEIICICKSPSHYHIRIYPDKAGEWMVKVEMNSNVLLFRLDKAGEWMRQAVINETPDIAGLLRLTIHNRPSIEHCKVYDVPNEIVKGEICTLKLRLADSDGNCCVFPQCITASVSIPGSETSAVAKISFNTAVKNCAVPGPGPSVEANVLTLSPNQYQISFIPFKTGPHTVQFQVRHIGILCSHRVFVVNKPDPEYCTASGPGLEIVKKHKYNPVSFLVRLADSDNEPCVSPQNVSVTLRMRETRTQIPVAVDPESESIYHLIYTPAVAGEMEVSVMVNRVHIKNSPWRVRVDNPPDLSNSRTSFSDIHTIKKSATKPVTADVYLMDSYNEPCVSEQTVFVVISGRTTSPIALPTWETIICTDIIYKSPSHYQVCFIPDKPGEWMVWVEVNGIPIFGSPFQINVYNIP